MKRLLFYSFLSFLSCQFLLGCTKYVQLNPTGGVPLISDQPSTPRMEGTSSGGGGFADTYAMEMLEVAKNSLAQMIENSSEKIYANLPQEKGQIWLANLIRQIEYKDIEVSRYDRPLKFDYDLENEKVYATRYFSRNFPYGRIWTRDSSERIRILFEVYFDILHEVSHFYGIGITEDSDNLSETWAMEFLVLHLGTEKYSCKSTKVVDGETTNIGLFLNPATGLSYSGSLNDGESNRLFEKEAQGVDISLILIPSQSDDQNILERHFWTYIGLANVKSELHLPTIDLKNKPYLHGESLGLNYANRNFNEWIVRAMGFPIQTGQIQNTYQLIYDEFYNPEEQDNKYDEIGNRLFQKSEIYELKKAEETISYHRSTTEFEKSSLEIIKQEEEPNSRINFECNHQFNPIKI